VSQKLDEKLSKLKPEEVQIYKIRHSAEHVLMQAMDNLGYKLHKAMGPATADGFYFDFELLEGQVTIEDFPKIEAEMQKIIEQNLPFTKEVVSAAKAKEKFLNNPYKHDWITEAEQRNDLISIYWTGEPEKPGSFVDLCAGPHVENTKGIGAFKLLSIAGAYWRGDEKNKMLTRIYGTAFSTKDELDRFLWQEEESKKRDHRKIGKEMELFTFSDEIGPGLPLWLPNGSIIKEELEKWGKETESKWGYDRVATPFLTKRKLFEISGHVPYFEDEMYRVQVPGDKEEEYFIKPMNCPFHHMVYKSKIRSYKDLPLRIAEYGTVARYEDSGALNGILRPRLFCQNDAHLYCTEEQAVDVFVEIINLHRYYYDTLGLTDYHIVLGLRDPAKKDKYHGDEAMWQKAEALSRAAMDKAGIKYIAEEEGAAHYGPKMDFKIKSVIGAEYGISTNQIDLYMPERFGLTYVDKDGVEKPVIIQHRAPLGSHERFVGFLIEHFAGAFPVWLHPTQVALIAIGAEQNEYVQQVKQQLIDAVPDLRVKIDNSNETLQKKIRNAQIEKTPYMAVIGGKEKENQTINVRLRNGETLGELAVNDFIARIKNIIATKSLEL
jgi:threonyl-tRNA synthetase